MRDLKSFRKAAGAMYGGGYEDVPSPRLKGWKELDEGGNMWGGGQVRPSPDMRPVPIMQRPGVMRRTLFLFLLNSLLMPFAWFE
jgi:hypothetical protein